nr:PREDICTED: uncharacterized protein LOC106703039 [Latimeria chalumnae]|eukprot:XP_014342487.1 PREDICTED: uncharacterized protein LOC106703039 [Latimeria chalumnae]
MYECITEIAGMHLKRNSSILLLVEDLFPTSYQSTPATTESAYTEFFASTEITYEYSSEMPPVEDQTNSSTESDITKSTVPPVTTNISEKSSSNGTIININSTEFDITKSRTPPVTTSAFQESSTDENVTSIDSIGANSTNSRTSMTTTTLRSKGWLDRVKQQYGIRQLKIVGKKMPANSDSIEPFRQELRHDVGSKNITTEQLYDADESGPC